MKTKPATNKKSLTTSEKKALGAVTKRFIKAWARAANGDISSRYALGQTVLESERTYGAAGIKLLAQAINRSESYLYSYAAVVKTWSESDLSKLQAESGGRVEWSHLILLSNKKLLDNQRRAGLLQQIISEGLSPTELKHLLYPKASLENIDSDLAEDGVVDEHSANDERNEGELNETELEETELDDAEPDEEAVAATNDDLGEPGEGPAVGVKGANRHVSFSTRSRDLRSFTAKLSGLAGDVELIDHQVFAGFTNAISDELTDTDLEDLASAKVAFEKLASVCLKKIQKLNVAMLTVQNAIIKKAHVPVFTGNGPDLRMVPSGEEVVRKPSVQPSSIESLQPSGI